MKKSKCAFGVFQIDYLGHVIFAQGVSMDTWKVDSILEWLKPTTLKG